MSIRIHLPLDKLPSIFPRLYARRKYASVNYRLAGNVLQSQIRTPEAAVAHNSGSCHCLPVKVDFHCLCSSITTFQFFSLDLYTHCLLSGNSQTRTPIPLSETDPEQEGLLVSFNRPLSLIQMSLSFQISLVRLAVCLFQGPCLHSVVEEPWLGIASGLRSPKDALHTSEPDRLHKSITLCAFKERTLSEHIFPHLINCLCFALEIKKEVPNTYPFHIVL